MPSMVDLSSQILHCAETDRVVAVFYNDYDLDNILEQLESEWIKTSERLPCRFDSKHDDNHHIDCYIFINNEVKERPWNIHHECWDDRSYDDFDFDALSPSYWMIKPLPPEAPE